MDVARLKEILITAFEYSYLHDDWVFPLDQALAGITVEQALRAPQEGESIWRIVLHLAVWNENIVERVMTQENSRPAEGAWPPLPDPADDSAWQASKIRLEQSLQAVRTMLETSTVAALEQSPYGIPDLLCRFTHMGYHIGQIVKMREIWAI